MIEEVISGGQTGVDRAALDAAIDLGIRYGGWCPKGRIDENGTIPEKYKDLIEISGKFKNDKDNKENYATRTRYNIRDSDGTLILVPKIPLPDHIKDGTVLTIQEVENQKKPYLMIDISGSVQKNVDSIVNWVKKHEIHTLNIAGPRETSSPGIYHASLNILRNALPYLKADHSFKAHL